MTRNASPPAFAYVLVFAVVLGGYFAIAGCTTGAVDPKQGDDSSAPQDPGGDDPQPTALSLQEVEVAFNAALGDALADGSAVIAEQSDQAVTLNGQLSIDGVAVAFESLIVGKGPFTVAGSATVSAREQSARIVFGGTPVGSVELSGAPLGTIEARFPAVATFANGATDWILGAAIDCQGIDLGALVAREPVTGECTLDADDGQLMATVTVTGLQISLSPLEVTGRIAADGPGIDLDLIFEGRTVDVLSDGELVAELEIPDLLSGLLP